MRTVMVRLGHVSKNGRIKYIEEVTTYEKAEELCGHKLDRRKNYCIINGEVCDSGSWTQECSGCDGAGCDECGYQGKTRESMWLSLRLQKELESGI